MRSSRIGTMIRLLERQSKQTRLEIEFLDLPGERIPLGDGTVDTVVSTFTLCTIPGVADAIRGVRRVLRPSGKLVFFEHALSPDPNVRRWQEWWRPIHHWVFEGLQLTRDTPSLITQGGSRSTTWRQAISLGSQNHGLIFVGARRFSKRASRCQSLNEVHVAERMPDPFFWHLFGPT